MNKLIIALGICIALFALCEANAKCRPQCQPSDTNIACVRNAAGTQCRKLRSCRMREENCRLRQQGQRVLIEANRSQCRNIKSQIGNGRCARIGVKSAKTIRRCPINPCKDDGKTRCWRNNQGQCQLLTSCQRILHNCRSGTNRALNGADTRNCRGMQRGAPLQRCRPIKSG